MTAPLGIQLYSVRENLATDFEGTLKKIAEIGYAGVETAGFPEGVRAAVLRIALEALDEEQRLEVACGDRDPLGRLVAALVQMEHFLVGREVVDGPLEQAPVEEVSHHHPSLLRRRHRCHLRALLAPRQI